VYYFLFKYADSMAIRKLLISLKALRNSC
jgi:hypothetical protein